MSDYHSRINNIPSCEKEYNLNYKNGEDLIYEYGNRDACHAASEIILEAE